MPRSSPWDTTRAVKLLKAITTGTPPLHLPAISRQGQMSDHDKNRRSKGHWETVGLVSNGALWPDVMPSQ